MWVKILEENPPKNRVLRTKIDDGVDARNDQDLIFDGKLWWHPDRSMYVYYRPTHCWNYLLSK